MKLYLVLLLSILFPNCSFGQNGKTMEQDSSWVTLKNTAHHIGFCIYHSSKNHCTDHSDELAEREKKPPKDLDVYYFEMKKEWAKNRLQEWEERQNQPAEDFLILFDVAQFSPSEKSNLETYNLFRGFILINLTDTIHFIFQKKESNQAMMSIESNGKNALMENTLWREFMTRRLGRFSEKIEFGLIGKNAEIDFEKFRKAFYFFQKEINK